MNNNLTVKLIADTNDIPVMFGVVEMTTGSSAALTYCVLQVKRVGWDTLANYDKWVSTKSYDINSGTTTLVGRDPEGVQGTLGVLIVATLSAIEQYATQTPSTDQ